MFACHNLHLCLFPLTERLRLEMTQRQSAELDQLARAHRTQMAAAKMELDRAIELKQRQVEFTKVMPV